VFVGYKSANANTTGHSNVAVGYQCLDSSTTGSELVAVGRQALTANTTAGNNVAVGAYAGKSNTTGDSHVYIGYQAGEDATTGLANVAVGLRALWNTTTGGFNTAINYNALATLTTGSDNTAIGAQALEVATTSSENTALGAHAGDNITTGSNNTCIGFGADTSSATASNEIVLGNSSVTKLRVPGISLEATSTDITFDGNLVLGDSDVIKLGDSYDLILFHDGSNSYISDIGTGSLLIRSNETRIQTTTGEECAIFNSNGAVDLYYDNVKAFQTNGSGAGVLSGGHFFINNATSGGVCAIEMGGGTAGDHLAYIDMTTEDYITGTYRDYGFRVIRYGGTNPTSTLIHRGTGAAGFSSPEGSVWSFSTSSDYRLKENVVSINDGITKLKTLKPYRFNFKHTPDKVVDGFIAHEVSTAVPNAVTGTKDEVMLEDGPLPGDLKKGDPVYQGIDYSKLTPLLTAALQEAIAKIEILEIEVAGLKTE